MTGFIIILLIGWLVCVPVTAEGGEAAGSPPDAEQEAIALAVDGEYERAGQILESLLRRSPGDPRRLYLAGMCRYLDGDRETARIWWGRAVELEASFPEPYLWMARLLRGDGDVDGARAVAETGLSRFPRHAKLQGFVASLKGEQQ